MAQLRENAAPGREGLSSIAVEVILHGSPDYESARKPAIARFHDTMPLAVVVS